MSTCLAHSLCGAEAHLGEMMGSKLVQKLGKRTFTSLAAPARRRGLAVMARQGLGVQAGTARTDYTQKLLASISSTQAAPPPPAPTGGVPSVAMGAGIAAATIVTVAALKFLLGKGTPEVVTVTAVAPGQAPASSAPPVVQVLPKVKRAADMALKTILTEFPTAIEQDSFIHALAQELFHVGFNKSNCIALVNTCRDEVCRPLVTTIDEEFGHSFNISGLGGLLTCGVTGMRAAMSHSPEAPCDIDGTLRERYIFFAFPHVSIGETGEVGSLLRRGRGKPSSACGALIAVRGAAGEKPPLAGQEADYPADDFEFERLKRKVLTKPACLSTGPGSPTLVDVTKATMEVITEDLETLIAQTVDSTKADYAVITGVEIHSGCNMPGEPFRMDRTVDYIAPHRSYAVIRGNRIDLKPAYATLLQPQPA